MEHKFVNFPTFCAAGATDYDFCAYWTSSGFQTEMILTLGGRPHFSIDKFAFLCLDCWFQMSLKFVPKGLGDNKLVLA